jgi:hypothetical protein
MEQIPSVLQYGVSQSNFRVNELHSYPQEGNQSAGGRYTVRLPTKSIINLSSLKASFDIQVTGLQDDAVNWANALIPASYMIFRGIQFRVGGSSVSGHLLQHYNQVYHALVRSTCSVDWATSRLAQGYQILVDTTLDDNNEGSATEHTKLKTRPTGFTSKTARLVLDDFLGLPRGNGAGMGNDCYIDTSLFGDCEIVFELDYNSCLYTAKAGTGDISKISYNTSNFSVSAKCVTSISPLYVELLSMKLNSKTPIRFPFENVISSIQTNGTTARLSVNTNCLDKFLVAPFNADPNALAVVATDTVNSNKFRFNSALTKSTAGNLKMQLRVGNENYPRQQIKNAFELAVYTDETFNGANSSSQNMLYLNFNDTLDTYTMNRSNFLSENCIFATKFCLSEGWASRNLTGISSSGSQLDIIAEYQNYGSYQLLAAFTTAQLVYDPSSGSVSVEA